MDPAHFYAASRVLIVAGKGGVGKTTVCAALARSASDTGRSVLIVRLIPGGALPRLFASGPIVTGGTLLRAGSATTGEIRARLVTPDEALLDYLADHGLQRITRRLVSSGALEVVTTAAPGIRDLLVLGRVKQLEQSRVADLIIVDAPAAGHAVSFLRAPAGLRDAVTTGPIATQAVEVLDMLADPTRSSVLLVTLAEETPVNELIETAFAVEDEVGVQLGPVIINALADPIDGLQQDLPALAADTDLDEDLIAALAAAADFRTRWVDQQRQQVERVRAQLPLPLITLPARPTTDLGPADLDALAEALTAGVDRLGTAAP
ncbi:MAG: hypothetical protein KGR18_06620 [Acidobacteria bacterium]|nr:hypothetical protein [Acidobacteriota bacterium]